MEHFALVRRSRTGLPAISAKLRVINPTLVGRAKILNRHITHLNVHRASSARMHATALSRDVFSDSAGPSDVRHYGRVERARSRRFSAGISEAPNGDGPSFSLLPSHSYDVLRGSGEINHLRSISFVIQQPTHGKSYWVRTRRRTVSRAQ